MKVDVKTVFLKKKFKDFRLTLEVNIELLILNPKNSIVQGALFEISKSDEKN